MTEWTATSKSATTQQSKPATAKNVVVTGGVYLEGKAYVNCDLECDSIESGIFLSKAAEISSGGQRARLDLTGRYVGKLEVNGNLTVHKQLNVSHSVKSKDQSMRETLM